MVGKSEDPANGLAFRFLADMTGEKVLTGHLDGVIRINIAEAHDPVREKLRAELGNLFHPVL